MTSIFKSTHKKTRRNNMTEGVRYPTFAFITGGVGQADEGKPMTVFRRSRLKPFVMTLP